VKVRVSVSYSCHINGIWSSVDQYSTLENTGLGITQSATEP
jgi:hypothetical protein